MQRNDKIKGKIKTNVYETVKNKIKIDSHQKSKPE